MSTNVLLPLEKCPHCMPDKGDLLLDTSKLMKYFREAPSNGLNLNETDGQELIYFNSEDPSVPCEHVLHFWGEFMIKRTIGPRERIEGWLDVDWCHPLMQYDESLLNHFVWEIAVNEDVPDRFNGPIPVTRPLIKRNWSAFVEGLGWQEISFEGGVVFASNPRELSQRAEKLIDAYDAWWRKTRVVQH